MSRKRHVWIILKKKQTCPTKQFLVRYFLLNVSRESQVRDVYLFRAREFFYAKILDRMKADVRDSAAVY